MSTSDHSPRKIAVIGGGISGLAAAHRLSELDDTLDVTLFEGSGRLGGVLQTEQRDGFLIERSGDMFTTREPWALDLCRRIGLEDELIETDAQMRKAFIVRRGKLVSVPSGFSLMSPTRIWPMVTTPLLSVQGKMRLAWEYFAPAKKGDNDESLADFARRRMGCEAYERIIQPLIGGIYTADPEKLSMAATMSQFVELERRHGSVIRGTLARQQSNKTEQNASGARYGMFLAPRNGMSRLVEAVAARLPQGCVRLNSSITELKRIEHDHWELRTDRHAEHFDGVVVATPSGVAGKLLDSVAPALANDLRSIPHASATVVVLGYRRDQIDHPLNGFGFVVPIVEQRRILAGSFASVKFGGRAPEDSVLIRVFVGGANQPELVELADDDVLELVQQELADLIGAHSSCT